jgi:predicted transcriptional regulator
MSSIKTAISLDSELFQRAEEIAREMQIPRSRLFVIALEEFIHRHQNQQLLDRINAAYADEEPGAEEQAIQRSMRQRMRQVLEGEW